MPDLGFISFLSLLSLWSESSRSSSRIGPRLAHKVTKSHKMGVRLFGHSSSVIVPNGITKSFQAFRVVVGKKIKVSRELIAFGNL